MIIYSGINILKNASLLYMFFKIYCKKYMIGIEVMNMRNHYVK